MGYGTSPKAEQGRRKGSDGGVWGGRHYAWISFGRAVKDLRIRDDRRCSSNPKSTATRGNRASINRTRPWAVAAPADDNGTKEEVRFDHRHKTKLGIWLFVPPGEVLVWHLHRLRRGPRVIAVTQGGGGRREGWKGRTGKGCRASSAKLAMLSGRLTIVPRLITSACLGRKSVSG